MLRNINLGEEMVVTNRVCHIFSLPPHLPTVEKLGLHYKVSILFSSYFDSENCFLTSMAKQIEMFQ